MGNLSEFERNQLRDALQPGNDAFLRDLDDLRSVRIVHQGPDYCLFAHDRGPMISVRTKNGKVAEFEIIEGEAASLLRRAFVGPPAAKSAGKPSRPLPDPDPWAGAPALGPLAARTEAEVRLYCRIRKAAIMEFHRRQEGAKRLLQVRVLHSGNNQRWDFWVDSDDDDPLNLGGLLPSRILTPVDFVLFASGVEQHPPAEPVDEVQRASWMEDLALAAEALLEACKFIPRGESRVPESAFDSTAAKWMLQKDPERFSRERLVGKANELRTRLHQSQQR